MFTGLVQSMGTIRKTQEISGGLKIEVETLMDLSLVQVGASICCSGCCLTVTSKTANSFLVDVSGETLSCTSLGSLKAGNRINLEPSLRVGDDLGGHFVSGHVDGVAEVQSIAGEGESRRFMIRFPLHLAAFIAPKGSVTLDGVSLTVNEVSGDTFGVNIIPHTWANTTFSDRKPKDKMNIEIDVLARYAVRAMQARL